MKSIKMNQHMYVQAVARNQTLFLHLNYIKGSTALLLIYTLAFSQD